MRYQDGITGGSGQITKQKPLTTDAASSAAKSVTKAAMRIHGAFRIGRSFLFVKLDPRSNMCLFINFSVNDDILSTCNLIVTEGDYNVRTHPVPRQHAQGPTSRT